MIIPDNVNFEHYAQQQADAESGLIKSPTHWFDEVSNLLFNQSGPQGDKLPWSKTHNLVRLRPGELTLWAGMNGHKKSMLLGQIMAWLARSRKIAIASLEMKPAKTLERMCRQTSSEEMSGDHFVEFMAFTNSHICIYDQLDKVQANRIIGFVYYSAVILGCYHIVIDSLTKCGISPKDSEAEKNFIDRLQWIAKSLGCHIHLVCHVRKPQSAGEEYKPTKFDVRGAGEIVDLCDNLFIVWADKRKTELIEKQHQRALDAKEQDYISHNPDQLLICAKQRDGEYEGAFGLWFHSRSLQFMQSKHETMDLELTHFHAQDDGEEAGMKFLTKQPSVEDTKDETIQ